MSGSIEKIRCVSNGSFDWGILNQLTGGELNRIYEKDVHDACPFVSI